jgi:hypothetical protein
MTPPTAAAVARLRASLADLAAVLTEETTPAQRVAVGRLLTEAEYHVARAVAAAGRHPKGEDR